MRSLSLLICLLIFQYCTFAQNLIPGDSSFETGYGVWGENGKIISADDAFDGEKYLEINSIIRTHEVFTLEPEQKYTMSCYLRAPKENTTVHLQGYRTNWDGKYINKWVKVGTKWQRYTLEFPEQIMGGHNKFWLVIKPENQDTVQVDAVQLEKAAQASEYKAAESISISSKVQSEVVGNIFYENEKVNINFQLYNSQKVAAKQKFQLKIFDYNMQEIDVQDTTFNIPAKNTVSWDYSLPKQEKIGFFLYEYKLISEDGSSRDFEGSFCIIKALEEGFDEKSIFGMSAAPEFMLPALARIGVRSFAIAFRWSYYNEKLELMPRYLEIVDRQVDLCRSLGIEPVLYLRRTPPWATMKKHPHDIFPPKEEFIHLYEDFAYKVAMHYKGRVKNYQLWGGEADLLAGTVKNALDKDVEWFSSLVAELHKYGYKGIKKADPEALVSVTGVSGVDCTRARFPFLSKVLDKAKGFYDEATIHPYCYPSHFSADNYVQSPEEAQMLNIYNKASQIAGNLPITNGEFGFSIAKDEKLNSPASQRLADYLQRSFLLMAAAAQAKRIMWYTVAGAHDSYSIWSFPNPRPAVATYANLAYLLSDAQRDVQELNLGSLVKSTLFQKKNSSMAVLWCPGRQELELSINTEENLEILDSMGNKLPFNYKIKLSESPVFVISSLKKEKLAELLQKESELLIQAVEANFSLRNQQTIQAFLSNQINKEVSGTITLQTPEKNGKKTTIKQDFTKLSAAGKETITLTFPEKIDLQALNSGIEFTGSIDVAGEKEQLDIAYKSKALPCYYRKNDFKIDADLSKWQEFPAIHLDSPKYLYPPDAASHALWENAADLSIKSWVAWNEEYFYFAARVFDDRHKNDKEAMQIWAGDCIQIAFDTLNNALSLGYDEDDREYSFGFSTKENKAVLIQTWPPPSRKVDEILLAAKVEKNWIDYELAIPISFLKPLKAEAGNIFSFNFVATDQDYNRIDYWMGLTYGICGGKNPSVFEKFILMPADAKKLPYEL